MNLQFSKIVIFETGYDRYSKMLYIISGGFIRTWFYANHIGRMPVSSFDSDSVYLKLFGTILSKCVPLSHGWFSNWVALWPGFVKHCPYTRKLLFSKANYFQSMLDCWVLHGQNCPVYLLHVSKKKITKIFVQLYNTALIFQRWLYRVFHSDMRETKALDGHLQLNFLL